MDAAERVCDALVESSWKFTALLLIRSAKCFVFFFKPSFLKNLFYGFTERERVRKRERERDRERQRERERERESVCVCVESDSLTILSFSAGTWQAGIVSFVTNLM